jgi:hypothetical protein
METGGRDATAFNLGTVIDFTEHQHPLFSAGRSIDGRDAGFKSLTLPD